MTEAEFRVIAADLIQRIVHRGLFSVPATWIGIAGIVTLTVAISILYGWIWWGLLGDFSSPGHDAWGGLTLPVIAIWIPLSLRGWVIDRWMSAAYFGPRRTTARLKDVVGKTIDHVFCATDLNAGIPFFFSSACGGRQLSEFYGRSAAPFVPLQVAVRASSAFPPLIPPIPYVVVDPWFRAKEKDSTTFELAKDPSEIWLTDGGAFNNFGTDWHVARNQIGFLELNHFVDTQHQGSKEQAYRAPDLVHPIERYGEIQLVLDASQREAWIPLANLILPIQGFLSYVARTMNVMYSSTLVARSREAHVATFARMKRSPRRWQLAAGSSSLTIPEKVREFREEGALQIYIPYAVRLEDVRRSWEQRPRLTPDSQDRWFAHDEDIKRELAALGDLVSGQADFVPTTLGSLKKQTVLKLVVAGYLNTREGIYGPFDYRPKAIPSRTWFEELLSLQKNDTRKWRLPALIGKYLTKRSAE